MAHGDEAEQTISEKDIAALRALIMGLNGRDRKARQSSAHMVALIAAEVSSPMADCLGVCTNWGLRGIEKGPKWRIF